MPPILLISDSADNLFYGMARHPFFESSNRFLEAIRATAQQDMTLFELDGATGNERLYHYFLTVKRPGPLIELVKCRNHQTNLVEGGLILASSPPGHNLLSLLFSFTHFIRTGGHWVRLKQAVRDWVKETAVIHTNQARSMEREAWKEHTQELRSFVLSTDRLKKSIARLSSTASEREDPTTESDGHAKSSLEKKVDDFTVSWHWC